MRLLLFGTQLLSSDTSQRIDYTPAFLDLVRAGEVKEIRVNNESGSINGTLANNSKITTMGPKDIPESDAQLFRDQKVAVEFYNPQPNVFGQLIPLLLPVVLIIAFFVWMQRRAAGQMGNVMSIGRSRAKAYSADKPSTTFADIAGYEGVKQEIKEVVDFLKMPERFTPS